MRSSYYLLLLCILASVVICGCSSPEVTENNAESPVDLDPENHDADSDLGDDDDFIWADDDDSYRDDDDDTPCPDEDEDGYAAAGCGGADCDDTDPLVRPGEYDICGDQIDNDCDGTVDNPIEEHRLPDEFIYGASFMSYSDDALTLLPQIGMRWMRVIFTWKNVMPVVPDPNLVIGDVDQTMIDDLLDTADWSRFDTMFQDIADAGLNVIPVVGHGHTYAHSMIDGDSASPDRLGQEHYLAYMYLYVRAAVERYDGDGYKDAPGIRVKVWQIENELNQAYLTAGWGWRDPSWLSGLISSWGDVAFTTELLATLNRAVHESDATALTTANIHTDIHPNISRLFGKPSWIETATLWRDHMDLVGFDTYPNYYVAQPAYGELIGERAQIIREASCGKPVILMEAGYPTGPSEMGFTEELQEEFIEEGISSALAAGVVGYLHFGLKSNDTHSQEITPADISNMQMIAPLFTNGDVFPMVTWALMNLDYVQDHLLDMAQAVEGYWGVIGPDGEPKPGYYILKQAAEDIYGL